MNENEPKKDEATLVSAPVAAAPSKPKPVYVERYEAEQHDDGASWIHIYRGWDELVDGKLYFRGKQLVGILPLKFPTDLRESAKDFAWLLNRVRADRIKQGHYVPTT